MYKKILAISVFLISVFFIHTTFAALEYPPVIDLSASPTSVQYGSGSTISWNTTYATSCSASGDWAGTKPTSGSVLVVPTKATSTYSLTCTGNGGSTFKSVTVTIASAPIVQGVDYCSCYSDCRVEQVGNQCVVQGSTVTEPWACTGTVYYKPFCYTPTVDSFTATPTSVQLGSSVALKWSSSNATSCTGTGFSTGGAVSNTTGVTVTPSPASGSNTVTFSIICSSAAGSDTKSLTVTTYNLSVSVPSVGTIVLGASKSVSISTTASNVTVTSYSANPTPTDVDASVSSPSNTGGTLNVNTSSSPGSAVSTTKNITVTATGTAPNGSTVSASTSTTANVVAPDLTAGSVSPTSTTAGVSTQYSATVSNIGTADAIGYPITHKFQFDDADHTSVTFEASAFSGPISTYGNATITANYTFTTAGTYYVRACADSSSAITESNEGNNCGSWTTVTVSPVLSTPTVSTSSVTNITSTSATTGGNVISDGGSTVTARGIVYGTSPDPSFAIRSLFVSAGSGTGSFSASLTGLSSNTTYYVRAYATNNQGTSYGSNVSFKTLSVPICTSPTATSITSSTATLGGTITYDGGSSITSRGVAYGASSNPTAPGTTTTGTTGSFSIGVTGLSPNTTYHFRPYATNSVGTGYCSDSTFTTLILYPDLTVGSASPTSAQSGSAKTFSATITNQGSGIVGSDFSNTFQVATGSAGTGTIYSYPASVGISPMHSGDTQSVNYTHTFSSTGTQSVRFCVDTGYNVSESNENNNCGAWADVTISALTASLSASPNPIAPGSSSTLSWSSTGATSCTGTGFSTGGAVSNATGVTVTPTSTTTYSLTCTNGTNSVSDSKTVNVSTGSISVSPSSCLIGSGLSTCSTYLSWLVTNPMSGANTAVTKTNPNATVSTGTSGTNQSVSISLGSTNFYLYHNGAVLASTSATASCDTNLNYNTSTGKCESIINGQCSGTHYGCIAGDSINNVDGIDAYTWDCKGLNGGTTATGCTESKVLPVDGVCSTPYYNCSAGNSSTHGGPFFSGLDTTYTWHCDGLNGGVDATNCSDIYTMSGSISGSACTIAKDGNSCTTTISWSTTNPQATSSVRSSYPSADTQVSIPDANSGTQSVTIPYSSRDFYLYNNSQLLDQTVITASCVSGTSWDGTKCAEIIGPEDGVCASTHFNCSVGNSTNNTGPSFSGLDSVYNWQCDGLNGGTNASCSESLTMSGYLSPTSNSCTIPDNGSDCSVNMSWSTTNAQGVSAVTSNYPSVGTTVFTGDSGSQSVTIPYSSRDFFLYNNNQLLDQKTITASCLSGSSWDGAKCVSGSNPPGVMSGSLTTPSCTIPADSNSCNAVLTWSTTNPEATSAVTSDYPNPNTTVASGNSGTISALIPYGSRNFFLYNNSVELASGISYASCDGTSYWNGSNCVAGSYTPTATINATPSTITEGASSTLSWSSTGASSCSGTNFDTGGATSGSVSVTPPATTTYSLVCVGSGIQASDQAVVTVTVTAKKPLFKEN